MPKTKKRKGKLRKAKYSKIEAAKIRNVTIGKQKYHALSIGIGSEYVFTPSEVKNAKNRSRKLRGLKPLK